MSTPEAPADQTSTSGAAAPETLFAFQFPSDPQVSPDGRRVAFVMTRIAEASDRPTDDPDYSRPRYRSRIQLSDGGPAQDLTFGKGTDGLDTAPLWSPDGGSLAFLSDRAGRNQLFLLPLRGGEARQFTTFKAGVSGAAFSPDGRYLSFLSGGDAHDRRDERGEARAVTSVRYRSNGRGMLPGQPAGLYLHDLQSGETVLWCAPALDIADYVWRPDSGGVLLVSSASEEAAVRWQQEVFELELGQETPRQLTRWAAPLGNLAAHPDGVRFAAVGRPPGSVNTEDLHVFLFGPGGEGTRLDVGWDRPAGNIVAGDLHVGRFPDRPVWADSHTLRLLYTVGGSVGLFDLGLEGVSLEGTVTPCLHDPRRVVTGFTAIGDRLAHISESATEPTEVYLNGVKVTDCAASLPFTPLSPSLVTFRNELGEGEGWVLLPPGPGQARGTVQPGQVPALLSIHGGPHTAYGHGFMHEFQLFAQAGYGVCYSNPRGSVGYGQRWSDDIAGRWGSVDMADLLSFFDAALAAQPRLDAARTGVMGGSYGGFMTNWITSQTGRFQVAVTDRSICNLISFGGTSDIGMRFWDDELGGNFQRSPDVPKLWDMSPLKYVERVTTPTLIIHSLEDLRCPVEQAEQWFAGLQLHGVESRFVRFPEENHELSRSGRPDRRVRRLQEYLDWIGAHLKA
ncbi:prolyl oligopeptidase family serine peptidase [Deinococcus sp.]|uniref:S9 family peptidase n=1 Tax=Deinococcus sp. TaxID=47478 RepID=UPI003C7BD454